MTEVTIDKRWLSNVKQGTAQQSASYRVSGITELTESHLSFIFPSAATGPKSIFFEAGAFSTTADKEAFFAKLMSQTSLRSLKTRGNSLSPFYITTLLRRYALQPEQQITHLYLYWVRGFNESNAALFMKAIERASFLEELALIEVNFRKVHSIAGLLLSIKNLKKFAVYSHQISLREVVCLTRVIEAKDSALQRFRGHFLHGGVAAQIDGNNYRRIIWQRVFSSLLKQSQIDRVYCHSFVFSGYFTKAKASAYVQAVLKELDIHDSSTTEHRVL